ncbi:hypothetical protein [Geomonas anaerohicana]|uniref:Zinc ribbon domain-containing protein n=1 Tax=Geomonas anaerohicana TaxID=2798583 RepID=A0ABS0YDC3_9BACT|nr:hypothetical protein [Geomonas anaerohicana]MBJ6750292.1 hypothetical protein [Geomonas anaerohicana]
MPSNMMEWGFVVVFFLLPGTIGAYVAYSKGRNPLLWFLVNGLFAPTVMITLFQRPLRPVQGHYRQCPNCSEFSKWRESSCRFCGTALS